MRALTETSSFDALVTVPEGGDGRNAASVSTSFQQLANRTKYLNDMNAAALFQAQAGTYSPAGSPDIPVSLIAQSPGAGFSVSSGGVLFPSNGYYEFSFNIIGTCPSSSANLKFIVGFSCISGTPQYFGAGHYGFRLSTSTGEAISVNGRGYVPVTARATQRFALNYSGANTQNFTVLSGDTEQAIHLLIKRVW